jgi:hypothetical protein
LTPSFRAFKSRGRVGCPISLLFFSVLKMLQICHYTLEALLARGSTRHGALWRYTEIAQILRALLGSGESMGGGGLVLVEGGWIGWVG